MANETRFSKLADLVLNARALPAEERDAFLKRACGNDADLYAAALRLAQVPTAEADRLEQYNPLGPSPERPEFPSGAIFGKYRILQKIADGGMSTVYLAEHIKSRHKVAVKFLNPSGLRFSTREHELLGELSHDNIARLFDSDVIEDGTPYLVLEYVEGESLTAYCDTHSLPLEKRLELFFTICKGIQHAHSAPIVHRDIKPENVLIAKEGIPKIVDFGIARSLPPDIKAATLTHGAFQPMTLAFASPEQIIGPRVGIPSDIYSLGMLLCVLLTGRLPYQVRTAGELYTAIPTQQPTRPSDLLEAPLKENPRGELYYPYLGPAPPPGEPRWLRQRLVILMRSS
jgi:eukaryotic-like serine/threonine-protein kinase